MSPEHSFSRPDSASLVNTPSALSGGAADGRWSKWAAFLAVGWSVVLVILVFSSAGSFVVGPGQVQKSDVVVSARLVPQGRDRVEVERVFKGEGIERGAILRILNLSDIGTLDPQSTIIFPLTKFHGDFTVTKLEGQRPDSKPLIYPLTTATVEQTKSALRD